MAAQALGDNATTASPLGKPTISRWQVRPMLLGGRGVILGTLAVVLCFGGWEFASANKLVDPMFLPRPLEVITTMGHIIASDTFPRDLKVSSYEFGLGLGLSIVLGGIIGILSGWYKAVEEFLNPLVISLNSVPHLALIPLLILIFGIGTTPKVILVLMSCIVVMIMNTAAGVENVDRQLMQMSRSFGASDRQIIRTVVLPAVIPYFMSGVRISVGRAVVAVAIAEIFASVAGLGNILIKAQSSLNIPAMYATVLLLTIIGVTLTQMAAWLERYLQRWKA
jgi:ABC-type nitrate/sulfonate/bicarbonate transport system permease component